MSSGSGRSPSRQDCHSSSPPSKLNRVIRTLACTSASSTRCARTCVSKIFCIGCGSTPSSAAISAATRTGQLSQASRSSRASRNTSAVARVAIDQLAFCALQRKRARCALAISCAVRACTKVTLPPAGSPCSFSVSRTEPTAASATGRRFSGFGLATVCVRPGSLDRSHDASALAASTVPSGSKATRPVLIARRTATWLTPR